MVADMDLGEKQELFARLEAEWVLWALSDPDVKLRQGEGRILQLGADGKSGRRVAILPSRQLGRAKDLVHKNGGTHYNGVAKDWQLFYKGEYITVSDHPKWVELGEKWESMHELCRWGGRFVPQDGNHISLEHNGYK